MIVETTLYFAKSGCAQDVLDLRRRGCRLRRSLGLPEGNIFVRLEGPGPDVRWQCTFDDEAMFRADLAARDASDEFRIQREMMGALLDRFERHVDRTDEAYSPRPNA